MTVDEVYKVNHLHPLMDTRTGEIFRFVHYNESAIKGFALCETLHKGKATWIPIEYLTLANNVDEE